AENQDVAGFSKSTSGTNLQTSKQPGIPTSARPLRSIDGLSAGGRWRIKKSSLDRDILRLDKQGQPTVLVVDDDPSLRANRSRCLVGEHRALSNIETVDRWPAPIRGKSSLYFTNLDRSASSAQDAAHSENASCLTVLVDLGCEKSCESFGNLCGNL